MWEYITGALVAPRQTFRQVSDQQMWKEGFTLVLVTGLIRGMANLVQARSLPLFEGLTGSEIPYLDTLKAIYQSPLFSVSSALIGGLFSWFVTGLIAYGLARLFKGSGTLQGLLAATGFATSVFLIGSPLLALASLPGRTAALLVNLLTPAILIWSLLLNILAVGESLQVRTTTAALTYLLTLLIFMLICAILLIITGVLMAVFGVLAASSLFH